MQKFEKDKVVLLKTLQELVEDTILASTINPAVDEDVSEYITDLTNKRNHRKLKKLGKALDKYIKEVMNEERLKQQERLYNEVKLKQTNEAYAAHCNADQ